MIPLMVGMAGASMLANHLNNKQADKQNAKAAHAAATQTQFSPWTKMGAGQAQYTPTQSNLNAGLQGAMGGASFAQSYGQAESQKGLVDAQKDYYQSMSQPQMTSAPAQPQSNNFWDKNPYSQQQSTPSFNLYAARR
jgi:hypothetical protein